MLITLIAAVADNRAIGKDNALAWDMPADREFFMNEIRGHDVVMGRRTYESHHEEDPIPYRKAIVVTRQTDYSAKAGFVCHSLEEAYNLGRQRGEEELFILGGGGIYEMAIQDADRLIITEIHTTIEGDAFFPAINLEEWTEVSRKSFPADSQHRFPYEFVRYERS